MTKIELYNNHINNDINKMTILEIATIIIITVVMIDNNKMVQPSPS